MRKLTQLKEKLRSHGVRVEDTRQIIADVNDIRLTVTSLDTTEGLHLLIENNEDGEVEFDGIIHEVFFDVVDGALSLKAEYLRDERRFNVNLSSKSCMNRLHSRIKQATQVSKDLQIIDLLLDSKGFSVMGNDGEVELEVGLARDKSIVAYLSNIDLMFSVTDFEVQEDRERLLVTPIVAKSKFGPSIAPAFFHLSRALHY